MRNLAELIQWMKLNPNADWSNLPTFGGTSPARTIGVWSWDDEHQIEGTCAADIKIRRRA